MAGLSEELAAYIGMLDHLEDNYLAQWVVIHNEELVGSYPTFQEAAEDAVRRFGRGPYLIRQVGAPPLTLPVSVVHRPGRADG